MKTFKENSHKAKNLFIEAVKRIAKEDWKGEISALKVSTWVFILSKFVLKNFLVSSSDKDGAN